MQQTITAIYQNGVLRPLVLLDLPENAEVEVELKTVETKQNAGEQISELLVRKGLSLPRKKVEPKPNLAPEERARLAEVFSAPQPLGEIISEDREEKF